MTAEQPAARSAAVLLEPDRAIAPGCACSECGRAYGLSHLGTCSGALIMGGSGIVGFKEVILELAVEDLKIDTYRAGDEVGIRITHLPTGCVGTSDSCRSELAAKQQALERLRARLDAGGSVEGTP